MLGSSPPANSSEIIGISEMFPDIPLDYVRKVYRENNGDTDSAVEELLSYNCVAKIEEEEKKDGEDTKVSDDSKNDQDKVIQVDDFVQDVKKCVEHIEFVDHIMEWLKIDQPYRPWIEEFCERNKYSPYKTVIDIMENYDPTLPVNEQPRISYNALATSLEGNVSKKKENRLKRPPVPKIRHSAVQGGYKLLQYLDEEQKLEFPEMSVQKRRRTVEIDPKSMDELMVIRRSNSELLHMPDIFFTDALQFFHNSVDAVLYLATNVADSAPIKPAEKVKPKPVARKITGAQVISKGCWLKQESITKPETKPKDIIVENGIQNGPINFATLPESQRLIRNIVRGGNGAIKSYHSNPSNIISVEQYNEMEENQAEAIARKLRQSKQTNQVDLHGLTVKSALQCTKNALNSWWKDEMAARIRYGDNLRSSKIQRVENFIVITGRGLHSVGGKAKVKPAIERLLRQDHYIYDQDASYFIVSGKKPH